MLAALTENWWVFLLRGIFAILFALAAYLWPGMTLWLLIVFAGAYFLLDGIMAIVMGFKSEEKMWPIVGGLISVVAGIMLFARPGVGALAVLLVIGIWAIAHGVADIVLAIRVRREVQGEWALALAGIVQIAFGIMVIMRPGAGALSLIWLIATFVLLTGLLLVALALRLRKIGNQMV